MTISDVKPDQEVKPEADTPKVCQILFTLQLTRWLKWPKWSRRCNRRATWSSLLMCCGETSYVCNLHKEMAGMIMKGIQIRCTKCGSIDAQMVWSRLLR